MDTLFYFAQKKDILIEMSETFKKTIENFTCGHCGAFVKGNGYTNHCPRCLWSKHVDIHPGDRAAQCSGLMEPVGIEVRGHEYILLHKCTICGYEKKNISSPEDDFDDIIKLVPKDLP